MSPASVPLSLHGYLFSRGGFPDCRPVSKDMMDRRARAVAWALPSLRGRATLGVQSPACNPTHANFCLYVGCMPRRPFDDLFPEDLSAVGRVEHALAAATRNEGLRESGALLLMAMHIHNFKEAEQAVIDLLDVLPATPQRIALRFALGVGDFEKRGVRLQDRRQLYMSLSGISYRTVIAYEREAQRDVAVMWGYMADVAHRGVSGSWIWDHWDERMAALKRRTVLWIRDDEPVFAPRWLGLDGA